MYFKLFKNYKIDLNKTTKKQTITCEKKTSIPPESILPVHAPCVLGMNHAPREWQKCTYAPQMPKPCAFGMLIAGKTFFFVLLSEKILVFRLKQMWKSSL